MPTRYPYKIDTVVELPLAVDLVTPVDAVVVNTLREAIIAVETELGIDPSREFGTVRDRLDSIQGKLDALIADGVGGGILDIISISNVSTLRSTVGSINKVAILLGYSAVSDGGGGIFEWNTGVAIDDGGTILHAGGYGVSHTGYWQRVYSGPLDVRWFGAVREPLLIITDATTTSPIAITTNIPHKYSTGDIVRVYDVFGNTAADGKWTITVTGDNTFRLNTSVGVGTYTPGTGFCYRVTDASSYINLAIAACPSGGKVYFPQGCYSATSVLSTAPNITLDGDGSARISGAAQPATRIADERSGSTTPFLHFTPDGGSPVLPKSRGMGLSNLILSFPDSTRSGYAVLIDSTTGIAFKNVRFEGPHHLFVPLGTPTGVAATEPGLVRLLAFEGVTFEDCTFHYGTVQLSFLGSGAGGPCDIKRCWFYDCNAEHILSDNNGDHDYLISGCAFDPLYRTTIPSTGVNLKCNGFKIENCSFYGDQTKAPTGTYISVSGTGSIHNCAIHAPTIGAQANGCALDFSNNAVWAYCGFRVLGGGSVVTGSGNTYTPNQVPDNSASLDPFKHKLAVIISEPYSGASTTNIGPDSFVAVTGTALAISGASNTNPIEITTAISHGLSTDDWVTISGVGGNTAANGTWQITKTAANKFTLQGSIGNGLYTSGGTATPHWSWWESYHVGGDAGVAGYVPYTSGRITYARRFDYSSQDGGQTSGHITLGGLVSINHLDPEVRHYGTGTTLSAVDTAPNIVTNRQFTGAVTYNLPPIKAGYVFTFQKSDDIVTPPYSAPQMTITAYTGEKIFLPGSIAGVNSVVNYNDLEYNARITIEATYHYRPDLVADELRWVVRERIGSWMPDPTIICKVNDVTQLRALVGASGQMCILKDYATDSDGGGGLFEWNPGTATDDGGTIFHTGGYGVSHTGYWQRVYSSGLDIRWFGASTSSSDNVAAIQRAISAAANTVMKTLLIPSGTWNVLSTSLPLILVSDVVIVGDGYAATLQVTGADYNNLFQATDVDGLGIFNIRAIGNGLSGNNDATGKFLTITGSTTKTITGFNIENCYIENFRGDYWIDIYQSSYGGAVDNVNISSNHFVSKSGNCRGPTDISIASTCIAIHGAQTLSGGLITNARIFNNIADCSYIKSFCLAYNNTKNIVIHGNTIDNAGQFGGIIDDAGSYAIMAYNSNPLYLSPEGVEIYDNIINSPRSCGIYAAGAVDILIQNNKINGQTDATNTTLPKGAIALNAVLQANVTGNMLINNRFSINAATAPTNANYITIDSNDIISSSDWAAPSGAAGIVIAPYTGVTLVGEVEISNNTVFVTGTNVRSIFIPCKSTEALKSLVIKGNNLKSTYSSIDVYSADSSAPNIETLEITDNIISSTGSFGVRVPLMSNTLVTINNNDFREGWDGTSAYVLDINNSTKVRVGGNIFNNFQTGTGVCLNTTAAQGILLNNNFINVATSRRYTSTGSEELGVDTPTWTGSAGMFVQDLATTVTGSSVRFGWIFGNDGYWHVSSTSVASASQFGPTGQQNVQGVSVTPGWTVLGSFYIDATTYSSYSTMSLEGIALVSNNSLTGNLRLYDITAAAAVTNSSLTIGSAITDTLVASSNIKSYMTSGRIYQFQAECTGGTTINDYIIVREMRLILQ